MSSHDPLAAVPADAAESYEVLPGRADAGLVVVCDHASNALPAEYGTLGLPPEQLKRHIAYDIGAAAVTRAISEAFQAPAVLSRFSRLLIDPNRGSDDPTLIMRLSDGAVVPGNRHLDEAERQRRIDRFWLPYHRALAGVIDRCLATGRPPVLLSIHSFTESWKGVPRPWHVGILWDRDARLARPLIDAFSADGTLIVGDNEPYRGALENDCMWQHGTRRGLAHAIVEIRQDLIRDAEGQSRWARRTIEVVDGLRRRPDLRLDAVLQPEAPGAPNEARSTAMSHGDDGKSEIELQAAVYRRLVEHLRTRSDVQNIDLMNLAGFCRNCLANWYQEAAAGTGKALSKDEAREIVYGMPYKDWQQQHQKAASAEQLAKFETARPKSH